MTEKNAIVAGVTLTHPDKVLYPEVGLTKRQLAEYLAAVAEPFLRHGANHPVSLVRCPDGIGDKCFYQKHLSTRMPKDFKTVGIREKDGDKADYLYIDDIAGLVGAAQIGALELHLWGRPRMISKIPIAWSSISTPMTLFLSPRSGPRPVICMTCWRLPTSRASPWLPAARASM